MRFSKYHALGNDYLVLNPTDYPAWPDGPPISSIRTLCHRNFGVGSDGILWGPLPAADSFGLRIFNPDGSEAEKSGNGLRIFARYLWDAGLVTTAPFVVTTPGGQVDITIRDDDARVSSVGMGRVSFHSRDIPVSGDDREVLNETIELDGEALTFCAATIGNPHCVLPVPAATAEQARRFGPTLEVHPWFPHRTNVQFLEVIDRANIRIEIWERGAGYTLASGSSSSAAAAVAHRLGRVDAQVTVHMPGGQIGIELSADFDVRMTGGVTPVATGTLHPELLESAARA